MIANRACELGPQTFDWWPDWRGQYCAIIASGPSTRKADIELLRGRVRVIAIKENVDLCPWADIVYGCDWPWWKHRRGVPEFKGLKLGWDERIARDFPDVKTVKIANKMLDRLLLEQPASIGSGGNSGFQAHNLAAQFGVNGILALGFDMNERSKEHWYGRNNWPKANNPTSSNYQRWRSAFQVAASQLRELGIDAVNASPLSMLKCFRRATVTEVLAGWGV